MRSESYHNILVFYCQFIEIILIIDLPYKNY